MKVILRPLAKDDWSGVIKYKNCYEDIKPYWTRSGSIYTGIVEDTAERLGKILAIDLKPTSEYWNTFYVRTAGKDVVLNLEDPMDELKYLFLKNHKRVKNSMFEHKATANFVLMNQEEESKKMNLYNRVKRRASREFDKMSAEEMRKALRLYGKSAENVGADIVENRLYELIEGDPQGFLDKWVDNNTRETQYIIERAVSMNIIRKNKTTYNYGTDIIGHGLLDAVNYLDDPKNQDIKVTIMKSIEGKTGMDIITTPPVKAPILKENTGKQDITLTPVKEVQEIVRTNKDNQ